MSDEAAIRALVNSYAIAVDHRDRAGFVQLWAENGTLLICRDGPDRAPTNEFRLPADVDRFMESRDRWEQSLHLLSTQQIGVEGSRATGEAYCEAHYILGSIDLVMAVRYDDEYVKANEEWRLFRRAVNVMWTSEHAVNVSG